MPVVEIHLIEGYSAADKSRLARHVTDAVRAVIPADPDAVTVMLHTLPREDYYRGGTTRVRHPRLMIPKRLSALTLGPWKRAT